MSEDEIKRLQQTLEDIGSIADKANKVFGFVKYVVWAVVGLGSIAIGSGVWVYATNTSIKHMGEQVLVINAEQKDFQAWRKAQDENNIRVSLAIDKMAELLKLHVQETAKYKAVAAANNP